MKIEWTKLEKEGKTAGHIDTNGFADTSKRAKYRELVEAEAIEELLTPQERWQSICKIAKEKAEEVLGIRKRGKRTNDQQIEQMAKEKHKLQKDIEATTDQNQRKDKLCQNKELKLKIRKRIKEVNTIQIENRLKGIVRMKNDSTRYFAVLKELKSKKEKKRHNRKGQKWKDNCDRTGAS